jgi:hypothetical protein
VKKLRAPLVLLLCLLLPWSAVASGMQNMRCHHHGTHRDAVAMTAAMTMHHHADQGCEHMQKCECQHHCAGGVIAAFVPAGANLPVFAGSGFEPGGSPGPTVPAWVSFPFRPPIAAPAGAA